MKATIKANLLETSIYENKEKGVTTYYAILGQEFTSKKMQVVGNDLFQKACDLLTQSKQKRIEYPEIEVTVDFKDGYQNSTVFKIIEIKEGGKVNA